MLHHFSIPELIIMEENPSLKEMINTKLMSYLALSLKANLSKIKIYTQEMRGVTPQNIQGGTKSKVAQYLSKLLKELSRFNL
jgi:hypothetical protein